MSSGWSVRRTPILLPTRRLAERDLVPRRGEGGEGECEGADQGADVDVSWTYVYPVLWVRLSKGKFC